MIRSAVQMSLMLIGILGSLASFCDPSCDPRECSDFEAGAEAGAEAGFEVCFVKEEVEVEVEVQVTRYYDETWILSNLFDGQTGARIGG